ncbi:hypothetical protein [Actinomadura atramentaria]|uniref:hypothetical protein n=1 Tax=Actinomadura atramentaria TaxID=1990 RepID=UPI000380FF27|nr:hypothetical protein [Actinomadura atramentaria]
MASNSRAPNSSLARLLDEARWRNGDLARAVNHLGRNAGLALNYDDSAVSHWLAGTMPRRRARSLVCEAFSRRLHRPITLYEAGLEPEERDDPAFTGRLREPVWDADILTGLITLGGADMDPSRRAILTAGLYSAALAIPGWSDIQGRFALAATNSQTTIGATDVDAVRMMTDHLSSLDDQFGGRTVRPMAAAFLVNTIAPLLQANASESVRRDLLSAAADHCYLTGYMAMDERADQLAQRYYLKALQLAAAADDHLTYATTLRGMSVMAVDLGHSTDALDLADGAWGASPEAGPRMKAFLAGQLAHAQAANGHRRQALTHLREAETAMEKAESQTKALGSYDPASMNYHIAQVRYAIGEKAASISAMEQADLLRDHIYRRARVRHLGALAERKLEIGHLEAACADWERMLDDYPHVSSGRCDDRFNNMKQALGHHRKNPKARQLLERATTMTRP